MSKPPARKKQKKPRPWQDIAREAQEHRDATIALIKPMLPPLPAHLPKNVMNIPATLLTPAELRTTDMVPEDLLRELAEGRLTAEAVTTAFLRRAGMAQGLVRMTSIRVEDPDSVKYFVLSYLPHEIDLIYLAFTDELCHGAPTRESAIPSTFPRQLLRHPP